MGRRKATEMISPMQAEWLEEIRVTASCLAVKRNDLADDEQAMRQLIKTGMMRYALTASQIRSVTDLFSNTRLYQIAGRDKRHSHIRIDPVKKTFEKARNKALEQGN